MNPLPGSKKESFKGKVKVARLPNSEGFKKAPVPKVKKKKPVLYLLAFLIFYFVALFSVQLVRYVQLNNEVRALDREITAIRAENDTLTEEIERLGDPDYLEELARGRLGMVRRGEILFYFQDAKQ